MVNKEKGALGWDEQQSPSPLVYWLKPDSSQHSAGCSNLCWQCSNDCYSEILALSIKSLCDSTLSFLQPLWLQRRKNLKTWPPLCKEKSRHFFNSKLSSLNLLRGQGWGFFFLNGEKGLFHWLKKPHQLQHKTILVLFWRVFRNKLSFPEQAS